MSPNKRRSSRQIVNLPAWIGVDNDADLRRCKIVDLSGFGARPIVEDVEALPDKFELFLSRFGELPPLQSDLEGLALLRGYACHRFLASLPIECSVPNISN